jgi:hypothetical protein
MTDNTQAREDAAQQGTENKALRPEEVVQLEQKHALNAKSEPRIAEVDSKGSIPEPTAIALEAGCLKCGAVYAWDSPKPPSPGGTFCPNCKGVVRGVLHFKPHPENVND